jgi:hypothetical protein
MADHAVVFHNPRTLTITGCRYEYQLPWPLAAAARGAVLAPAWLLAATRGILRGTARESSRRRRMHHDRSDAMKH